MGKIVGVVGILLAFITIEEELATSWTFLAATLVIIGTLSVLITSIAGAKRSSRVLTKIDYLAKPLNKKEKELKTFTYREKGGKTVLCFIAHTEAEADKLLKKALEDQPITTARGSLNSTNFYLKQTT